MQKLKRRCIFGERAAFDQLIGVSIMLTALAGKYYFTSFWLDGVAVACLMLGLFIYIIPGHALIYGPHLFIVALWETIAGGANPDEK